MILAIIASFKDGVIYFGGASRVAYALSNYDYAFPRFLNRMSSKGIPIAATTLSLIISLLFLALFPSFSSIFSLVVDGLLLSYAPGAVSLAVLRKISPDVRRPYKLPAFTVTAPLAFVVSALNHILVRLAGNLCPSYHGPYRYGLPCLLPEIQGSQQG